MNLKYFKICELGELRRGTPFNAEDLVPGKIAYVGASAFNFGITNRCDESTEQILHPAGCISIPYDGSIGYAVLQPEPFYVNEKCYVLYPKTTNDAAKLYLCSLLRGEVFRYNYGRKWNSYRMGTTRLQLPEKDGKPDYDNMGKLMGTIPDFSKVVTPTGPKVTLPPFSQWKPFRMCELGYFKKGERFRIEDMEPGNTPFIGATEYNNGITGRCDSTGRELHPAGCITIPYDGSIGYAFYQPGAFLASDSVNVFYPRTASAAACMFLCQVMRLERFRYNYGRKWHLERMQKTTVLLPSVKGLPDYELMSRYIMGCSFSSVL